jgi:hypothetical protein
MDAEHSQAGRTCRIGAADPRRSRVTDGHARDPPRDRCTITRSHPRRGRGERRASLLNGGAALKYRIDVFFPLTMYIQ